MCRFRNNSCYHIILYRELNYGQSSRHGVDLMGLATQTELRATQIEYETL